jgi:sugar O-acyltransferase (sialic acid O-acetyltransferase NeuD family)
VSEAKKVFIFGYSGHAYVVIESLIQAGYTISGYFDFEEAKINPYNLTYFGYEKKSDVKDIVKENLVFPGIGDNIIRKKIIELFEALNLSQFVAIDPSANVSKTATINVSTYIGKNALINAFAKIGRGAIINTNAIIEHECFVEDYTHIGPNAVLCGNVMIGENTFIGANSVVKNNIQICSNVTLGAGSVVVKSIEEKGIWVGNPAKKI